jgi:hypothetical protein
MHGLDCLLRACTVVVAFCALVALKMYSASAMTAVALALTMLQPFAVCYVDHTLQEVLCFLAPLPARGATSVCTRSAAAESS